jgi:hypothetical protein
VSKSFWIVVALVASGLVTGEARAQGMVELATDWAWPESLRPDPTPQKVRGWPSPREQSYGQAVTAAFGSSGGAARIGHIFHPGHDPSRTQVAKGVRVTLDDGTQIERFHFDSEQHAFDYAMYGADAGGGAANPALIEARGRQAVVIRGPNLLDAERAGKLLDAAWNPALPTPEGAPSVSASLLGDHIAIVTRKPDPIFDAEFQQSMDATRSRAESHADGFQRTGDGRYAFDLNGGVNGELSHHEGVRAVVVASTPEAREQIERQLDRALALGERAATRAAPAAPEEATNGASRTLNGLFD